MTATTSSRNAAPVRLTRRGQVVLVLLLAAVLLAAFSLGRTATQAVDVAAEGSGVQLQQTTVQPGESLWSVAQRIAPENDPRDVVAQIRRLNDLESTQLRVGQQLLLPVRA